MTDPLGCRSAYSAYLISTPAQPSSSNPASVTDKDVSQLLISMQAVKHPFKLSVRAPMMPSKKTPE